MANGLAALGRIAGGVVQGLRQRKEDDYVEEQRRTRGLAEMEDRAYQSEQRQRQRKQWEGEDSANQAFSTYLNKARDEWAARTGQPIEAYRPDLSAQVGALDARGAELARNGNWTGLLDQRTKAASIYSAARNDAIDRGLAQFDADGDAIRLAQTIYPHIRDGRKITMAKKSDDGVIQFSLDDGSTSAAKPDQLVQLAKRLRDPEFAAKMDVEMLKGRIAEDQKKRDAQEKRDFESLQQEGRLKLADVNNKAAAERSEKQAGATLGAAKIRAGMEGEGGGPKVIGRKLQALQQRRLELDARKDVVREEYKAALRDATPKQRTAAKAEYDAKMSRLNEEDADYRTRQDTLDVELGLVDASKKPPKPPADPAAKAPPVLKFDKNGNRIIDRGVNN